MIDQPDNWEAMPNIKKLIDNEFTVAKNRKFYCSVTGCENRNSLTDNDLCAKHEREMLAAADQWEMDKLAKKYGDEIERFAQDNCLHLDMDGTPFCPTCGISLAEIKQMEYEDRVDREIDQDKL